MTIYDICAHSSLSTLAIIVLGLLKKKERKKDDEQFCMGGGEQLHKRILAVFKLYTNAVTTVENACTVKSA